MGATGGQTQVAEAYRRTLGNPLRQGTPARALLKASTQYRLYKQREHARRMRERARQALIVRERQRRLNLLNAFRESS